MVTGVLAAATVVLLSIDGLKPDYVLSADAHGLKIPNLRRLVAEGVHASGVTGVVPTVTYPSHATMLTGVAPARHGIFSNHPFDPYGKNQDGWYWYASDLKQPTLWEAVEAAAGPALHRIGEEEANALRRARGDDQLVGERRALHRLLLAVDQPVLARFPRRAADRGEVVAGALLGVGLAHALPIPASLGALEGAQAAVFELAGDGTRMAIIAATVARIRDLGWTLPGVAWLAWNALRRSGQRR